MAHQHAIVWIDHLNAHVVRFGLTESVSTRIRSKRRHAHLHHKANSIGDGHASADFEFFDEVADALSGVTALLVTGPGLAKTEFAEMLRNKRAELAKALEGVETLNHPTDGELLKFARNYMHAADRMAHGSP